MKYPLCHYDIHEIHQFHEFPHEFHNEFHENKEFHKEFHEIQDKFLKFHEIYLSNLILFLFGKILGKIGNFFSLIFIIKFLNLVYFFYFSIDFFVFV